VGRIVSGANRLRIVSGANRLWGEMSVRRNVHGAKCPSMGQSVHGAKCPWGEKSINRPAKCAQCEPPLPTLGNEQDHKVAEQCTDGLLTVKGRNNIKRKPQQNRYPQAVRTGPKAKNTKFLYCCLASSCVGLTLGSLSGIICCCYFYISLAYY